MTKTALARFSEEVARLDVMPLWERAESAMRPGSACVPKLWRYAELRPKLIEAAALIDEERAERRVLVLENPALRGTTFVTNSLYAGLQIIMPGEIARTHRHTPNALRFLIEGQGGYTVIDGERVRMHRGDFVVTPSWSWHAHGNDGDGPVMWLDGLDSPFTRFFGATFRDNFPPRENVLPHCEGMTQARYGANLLPMDAVPDARTSPLLIYPYACTRDALLSLACQAKPHPAHGLRMRYANPATGGHVFPTMAVFLQLLQKGFCGAPYRSTDGGVFLVVEGSGSVRFGGNPTPFQPSDIFVIPPWTEYTLNATAQTVLFNFSDRTAQEALGFFREEVIGSDS